MNREQIRETIRRQRQEQGFDEVSPETIAELVPIIDQWVRRNRRTDAERSAS